MLSAAIFLPISEGTNFDPRIEWRTRSGNKVQEKVQGRTLCLSCCPEFQIRIDNLLRIILHLWHNLLFWTVICMLYLQRVYISLCKQTDEMLVLRNNILFLYPLFHYTFVHKVSVILVWKYLFFVSFSKKEYNFG